MVKEIPVSLDDGDMHKLSVQTDPTNEDSTRVKQKKLHSGPSEKPSWGSSCKSRYFPGINWQ